MQTYPGAVYKEHHYKVEEDVTFRDDFQFNKNSGMNRFGYSNPGQKHDHHLHDRLSPNMHVTRRPDHYSPNGNNKHGYEGGGYYGPNKNYSETIYEQGETEYRVNRFDDRYNNGHKHFNGGDQSYYTSGAPGYGGYKEQERYYSDGRAKGPAMWDCKGIDD